MPFLKYYGTTHPPSGVQDLVNYEDPEHPSKKGFDCLLKSINLLCESASYPREDWNNYLLEEIKKNPYEGMSHIGGVCKASFNNSIRPWDIEISESEYFEIRKNIENENALYRERIEKENERLNDPNQRALPEHEKLGWRSRIWVLSYAVLDRHTPYSIGEQAYAYCRVIKYFPNGTTLQLIDIYHGSTNELEEVMLEGLDLAEWLVDLLAVLGFGASHLGEFICTSPTTCREGVSFKIAAPAAYIYNKSVHISPSVLNNLTGGRTPRLVARSFRDGLVALHPASSIGYFWNSIEQTADKIAKKRNLKRLTKCKKCGYERNIGWDTKSIFNEIYAKTGINPNEFDNHRSLRGKVQHGGHLKSATFSLEISKAVSELQSVAAVAVSECLGIKAQVGNYLNTHTPIMTLGCVVFGEHLNVRFDGLRIMVSPICLPERYYEQVGRSVFSGIQGEPPINTLFVPPIVG